MTISGEQIREAALSHEKTCPAAMKESFYNVFCEGAKWMQHKLDHVIEGEMESGELLAYNCEKRAREEIIEKAVKWLEKNFDECRFGNHVYDYCIDDFDEYIAGFRKAMTEQ